MRIVVTGAADFLGQALVARLKRLGHRIVAELDGESPSDEPIALPACDVVYHLGASTKVHVAREHPQEDFDVNARGTVKLLEACVESKVNKVVFASTALVYRHGWDADEDAPTGYSKLSGPHGLSKLCAEQYLQHYADQHGIEAVIFRPSEIYGPGMKANPIFDVVTALLSREWVHLWHDPDSRFDFIYVDDVVEAFVDGLQLDGGVFNVSSGQAIRLSDLYKMAQSLLGVEVPLAHQGAEVHFQYPNHRLRGVGWQAKITLPLGIRQMASALKPRFRRRSNVFCTQPRVTAEFLGLDGAANLDLGVKVLAPTKSPSSTIQ